MKKIAVLAVVLLFLTVNANSQLTKGNWLVGGNISFSVENYKSAASTEQKNTRINLEPNIGYFFMDKFAGGAKVRFNTARNSIIQQRQTGIEVGPFLRYYFLPVDKNINFFLEAGDQFGFVIMKDLPTTHFNTFSAMAGPCIYFNQSVGLEFGVAYSSTKYTNETGRNGLFQMSIGLQVHLEKEK